MTITQVFHVLAGLLFTASALAGQAAAQTNQTQQLAFAGLRAFAAQGQFNAVKTDAAGNLFLLLDQGDGIRILKTDNAGSAVLAQTLLGASGDVGVAMALDPAGNIYVTGTSTSTALTATSGAAIPARTDATTNSFVAKFDASLNPLFVTFTGGSKIIASAIAATGDAVFVTGSLFSATLPTGTSGFQQTTAPGSFQNGFVEKFSSSGSSLLYATYLTGASGDTTPTAIAADNADQAYVAGATTSTNYPAYSALVPVSISNPSGFLTRLAAGGDSISFSTFIPGEGLSSLAIDPSGKSILLSGSVALGQFPVDTVNAPLLPSNYQVLVRMPLDGSTVQSATVIAPGQQSFIAPMADGSVWVDGTFTAPLLSSPALSGLGTGYAVHVSPQNVIDQTARFGGLPNPHATFASLPTVVTSIAVDSAGEPLIAGSIQPTASSALLATETYDLPLVNNLTTALPSTIRAAEMSPSTCNGSLCVGSGAYLAKLNISSSTPSLVFSVDDNPWLVLRNLGSATANGLQLTATNATVTTNCGTSLAPGNECDALLSGGGPATITATSTNAVSQSVSVPVFAVPATTIVFFPKELDFGVQASASPSSTRIITVSNLGAATLNFTSAIDSASKTASPFTEQSSDCSINGSVTTKVLAAGATCHVIIAFAASSTASNDGFLNADWSIGSRDVMLTGYSQAASLSVSANEIDFGTQYSGGIRQPRYVYLSNNSSVSIAHTIAALPTDSPFAVKDACPTLIAAGSECRLRLDYLSSAIPSADSTTLMLDQKLSVLLTGQTQAAPVNGGPTQNSNLSVAPASVTFPSSVVVTGVSGSSQTVSISNSGASAFTLALTLSGDFNDMTSCGTTLDAGQTCAVSLTFVPTQTGIRQGLLAVTAGGTSPVNVVLNGTGAAILASSDSTLDFGGEPIGQPTAHFIKVAQPFTRLTASTTGPYGVALIADAGAGPGQPPTSAYATTITGACPNCYLAVQFQPTAAGVQSALLTLSSDSGGAPYSVALTGIGVSLAGLSLTPTTKDYGSVSLFSTSSTATFTLTNESTTGASVTLSAPSVTGDFAVATTPVAGQACGSTLAFSASCVFGIAFTPSAIGNRVGNVSLATSNGAVSTTLTAYGTSSQGLAINPLALTFNNIGGPAATQQSITLTNTSTGPLMFSTPTLGANSFQVSSACSSLAIGASCSIIVTFLPGGAAVSDTLSIPVMAAGSSSTATYAVALEGTYTASSAGLSLSPTQANFGPTAVTTQGITRQFTISNLSNKAITLNVVVPRQFALTGVPCISLAAAASCTINVQFIPLTTGDITGTVIVNAIPSDGSASGQSISYVGGYGVSHAGPLSVVGGLQAGNLLNFGQTTSGQTSTRTLTITNTNPPDAPSINIRRITSGPPFLATTTCMPALESGQSCMSIVTYAPFNQVASGTSSPATINDAGVLTIESDASSSPDIINIAGQAGPINTTSPVTANAPLATFALSQTSFNFAAAMVGTRSPSQSITLTNTGNVPMHILSATTTSDFTANSTCGTLLPNASCSLTVTFTPQTQGTHIAALELSTDSTAALEFVSLLGTASPQTLILKPASLDFGAVAIGSSASLSALLTNTASTDATISTTAITGDYKTMGTCPANGGALPANSSCALQVSFIPIQTGVRTGLLSVTTPNSTVPLTTSLTGTGIQSQLTINPAKLDFGNVMVGVASRLSLTLSNTGTAAITNLAISVMGDFAVTIPCVTTLAPGDLCTLQITFTPTAAGARPATLSITSSDHNSPQSAALTGAGVASPSFTFNVNGANSANVTVKSGSPAVYTLTIMPTGGFSGPVALTCAAMAAGQYASCSLQPSTLALAVTAISATATINTLTTTSQLEPPALAARILLCLLVPSMLLACTSRCSPTQRILGLLLAIFAVAGGGCGGSSPAVQRPTNILYTPPGNYQYQVTASSTSGIPITQAVTLNLTVQ